MVLFRSDDVSGPPERSALLWEQGHWGGSLWNPLSWDVLEPDGMKSAGSGVLGDQNSW